MKFLGLSFGLFLLTLTGLTSASVFAASSKISCIVKPSSTVSIQSLEVSPINQRQAHINFKLIKDKDMDTPLEATEICDITDQKDQAMTLTCYANHGSITLKVNGGASKIMLEATGLSGETFEGSAIMGCTNRDSGDLNTNQDSPTSSQETEKEIEQESP